MESAGLSVSHCPNCRHEVPAGSRFCNSCGQRLTAEHPPASPPASEGAPPEWYRALFGPAGEPRLESPQPKARRIPFGILGKQPRKWLAEIVPGQRVRLLYATGKINPRRPLPWERPAAAPVRHPWTTQREGALLLIVGDKSYRFAEVRTGWVDTDLRAQVYVGIEDSRHEDNLGEYIGALEIAPVPHT